MKHLRYNCGIGTPDGHPQDVMKKLGITYFHATPQSMGDQWHFYDCSSLPEPLPEYLSIMDIDPMEQIGWGLNRETAIIIRDFDGVVPEPLTTDQERIKELKDDIRKIKIIMAFVEKDEVSESLSVFSFHDIELTKINWIKTEK